MILISDRPIGNPSRQLIDGVGLREEKLVDRSIYLVLFQHQSINNIKLYDLLLLGMCGPSHVHLAFYKSPISNAN